MVEEYYVGDPGMGGTLLGAFGWIVIAALYLYFSFMHYKIAQKTGQADNAWWAFVPILNTVLLIQMAEKPMWWFLLLLVPIVNVFAFFALWMSVAKQCGQSPVWGFFVLIPLINFVAVFVLAFNSRPYEYPEAPTAPPSQQPRTPQQVG